MWDKPTPLATIITVTVISSVLELIILFAYKRPGKSSQGTANSGTSLFPTFLFSAVRGLFPAENLRRGNG